MNTLGFVKLIDSMPRENLDDAIVNAARVSYSNKGTRSTEGLIRYLMRHWHTTPFEMIEFKFHIKMPIFVARQHMRHRTASINEISGRYAQLPSEYFVPENMRTQSDINKQGSSSDHLDDTFIEKYKLVCGEAFQLYETMLEDNCSREISRCHLPLSTYTEFYWKINLHNLLHYLQLRMDEHAQPEIREYANEIFNLVQPLVPLTMKAFMDFRVNSLTLSAIDIECINNKTEPKNPGELREFKNKMKILGIE